MLEKIINEENKGRFYFLFLVLLAYFILLLFNKNLFFKSLINLKSLFFKLIPVFLLVFILMFLSNLFLNQKIIANHLKDKGIKKWIFAIVAGILSSGPIYMWYPLLADLRKKGVSYGLIACFLYNRAIKIPLLPVLVYYFGLKYVIILTFVMVLASIIQGVMIDILMNKNS